MYTKCTLDFEVHCFFLAQKTAEPEVLLYLQIWIRSNLMKGLVMAFKNE